MQTRGADSEVSERDQELENLLGNLLIAEYQVDKLKGRLVERLESQSRLQKSSSTFIFKQNDRWYRIALKIDKMAANANGRE